MEPILVQTPLVTAPYTGPDGKATPWGVLRLAMNAAAAHSKIISADWETLAEKGLIWVVIRHKLVVERYPQDGETITIETWPMPTARTAYPRAAIAYDEKGNVIFRLVSLWVLVDIHKRKMVLPEKTGVDVAGILRGCELELPTKVTPQNLKNVFRRVVAEQDIDRNQHMNNARYVMWITDMLPAEFWAEHTPKEWVVCYVAEAKLGQELTLYWELSEAGDLLVDGRREAADGTGESVRVFSAKVSF